MRIENESIDERSGVSVLKLKEEVEYEHRLERVAMELNPSEEVLTATVGDGGWKGTGREARIHSSILSVVGDISSTQDYYFERN